jgi:hypothetical protein
MMDFLTRIDAVLHHEEPDQVPFAPYDNLVPRGEFVRKLRNRGGWGCGALPMMRPSAPSRQGRWRSWKRSRNTATIQSRPEGS